METQTKNIGEERKKSIIASLKKNLAYVVFMPFLFISIMLFVFSAPVNSEGRTVEQIQAEYQEIDNTNKGLYRSIEFIEAEIKLNTSKLEALHNEAELIRLKTGNQEVKKN